MTSHCDEWMDCLDMNTAEHPDTLAMNELISKLELEANHNYRMWKHFDTYVNFRKRDGFRAAIHEDWYYAISYALNQARKIRSKYEDKMPIRQA